MIIATQNYENIYQDYSDALEWMEQLGVDLGSGRTSNYLKMIRFWKDNYKTASTDEAKNQYPDFVSSMFEVHDFIDIYKSFNNEKNQNLNEIVEKLKKGVKGPVNSSDETSKSTTARNFLFEALFSAKFHRPDSGVKAILNAESDTGIQIDKYKIWVECKRISTDAKIKSNVRKASKQLDQIIKKQRGSGHRGIVALEITRILNPDDELLVSNDDLSLSRSVDKMMDDFVLKYSSIWQEIYTKKSNKILGIVIRFSFMSASEERKLLVHASQWGLNPRLGINDGEKLLLKNLVANINKH
ncbi:hypothetical protein Q4508_05440 [Amphritea sp. 2_MG-2023]|uniref:hypothetical protein n=1 Tax=Amphritea TaxID=515417 RepID=UPI001C06824D|nr:MULTISPECIES: hypothetical protein [Amphritea]MBU2965906.1 hypothetical protein [Amphritea atlantica]MDO6417997.1 hypothetical protein [Amphritea sp. 2_MG-2023]